MQVGDLSIEGVRLCPCQCRRRICANHVCHRLLCQRYPRGFRRLYPVSGGVAHDRDHPHSEYQFEPDPRSQIVSLVGFTAPLSCRLRLISKMDRARDLFDDILLFLNTHPPWQSPSVQHKSVQYVIHGMGHSHSCVKFYV